MDKISVIIPAAGQGKRMQNDQKKQFITLGGMPVIAHTLRVFEAAEFSADIVLVCAEGEEEYYIKQVLPECRLTQPVRVVTGGAERQDSVLRGLWQVPMGAELVMIHDGARPLVPVQLVNLLAQEVKKSGAVVPGVPVKDTIKSADEGGFVKETLRRDKLWNIQTPQVFKGDLIREAYQRAEDAGYRGTDDASLVEWAGAKVKIIFGSYENIKITTPEDLTIAEAIIRRRGMG